MRNACILDAGTRAVAAAAVAVVVVVVAAAPAVVAAAVGAAPASCAPCENASRARGCETRFPEIWSVAKMPTMRARGTIEP